MDEIKASSYIFTKDGELPPSDYWTLRVVCKKLDIPYGKYVEDGFIPHDLRHNFASDIIRHTDIETLRELLGHSNIEQIGDYLHTDAKRMREAIRWRAGMDIKKELVAIYKGVRRKKLKAKTFIERIKKLTMV